MEYGLVALWLVAYLSIGALSLPLAGTAFSTVRGRGVAFAIPIGLVTITAVGYIVGHLAFGLPALLAGLAVLAVLSVRFGNFERRLWRYVVEIAVVFAVAFLFVVSLRAVSPAIAPLPIAAGEKFLDYGLLRSLLRSPVLPPEDMWFAGEAVQYYYGGQMLTALLATLTDTAPRFAYNLALAGFYAALVTAAYGLAGAIAADHGAPRRFAAVAAAFFIGIAGNLDTAVRAVAWALPSGTLAALPGVGPEHELRSWTPTAFSYWDSSRIVEGTINEFPLFAWLNGDLHAHMMTTPFTLLVAGLCYAYWRTPQSETDHRRRLLLATAPVAGVLAITNTWDFPVAGGLVFLMVAFAPADPATLLPESIRQRIPAPAEAGVGAELRRDGLALLAAVAVLAVGALLVAPFWLSSASTRSLGLFPPRSDLWPLVVVHGGFLSLFVPYVGGRLVGDADVDAGRGSLAVAATVAIGAMLAWLVGFAALALFGPLSVAAWLTLRRRADAGFETLLVIAGLGLGLIVELAYVVEPQQQGTGLERLNTVFKVYSQVWILWAPAAGVVASRLFDPAGALEAVDTPRWRWAGTALVGIVIVATGLYAGFAVPAHLGDEPVGSDGATLDGTAYVDARYPEEAAAIAWLDGREGRPTIVTAAPGGYRWEPTDGEGAAAPASLTGVPTVLGWMHEEQYRGSDPYETRLEDVTAIYEGGPDRQSELLDRYGVEYVYVGPAERARYDLTVESHPRLEPAFEGGETVVYAVRRE
ncbi:DUF2298 family protein [Natronomonas moolapensis 8.8.11]|uniref:DUF2298 family protein n=1 Tax=Natronomonas moolapensis (strain DSM 18674 / CECT 7526 / JCM 14361 / 8.8.11) TaxID=268739 RepID=M1XPT3_NATM8|nr:DUF2298 domain-containing protein [Natronomonas moolapensis]CCQ36074.1 DUF2298 family protein [Natronomonas moolapensis 8.8.11]